MASRKRKRHVLKASYCQRLAGEGRLNALVISASKPASVTLMRAITSAKPRTSPIKAVDGKRPAMDAASRWPCPTTITTQMIAYAAKRFSENGLVAMASTSSLNGSRDQHTFYQKLDHKPFTFIVLFVKGTFQIAQHTQQDDLR